MRFVCNIMKGPTCLGWVSIDNIPGETADTVSQRAADTLMRDATRGVTLSGADLKSIKDISREYERLVREAMRSESSSKWTILKSHGKYQAFSAKEGLLAAENEISGHICLYDDDKVMQIEALLDNITSRNVASAQAASVR